TLGVALIVALLAVALLPGTGSQAAPRPFGFVEQLYVQLASQDGGSEEGVVAEAPAQQGMPRYHVVQRGENLISIAARYGTTVEQLVAMNNISNPNRIYAGQSLIVGLDGGAPPPSPAPEPTAPPPDQGTAQYHIVQRGENLTGIAYRYGVTVAQIVAWNNISNPNFLRVGQRLMVSESGGSPPPAPSPADPVPTPPSNPTPAPSPSPSPSPSPEPPPPGNTSGFRYGLQAHMVYEDRGRVINATKDVGFGWLKQQVEWKVFEPAQGEIHWGELDNIVNDASGAGLNLLFSVVKSPSWARAGGRSDGEGPPQDGQHYANFVGALAGRYCGKVQAIEIWNEQNLVVEWADRPISAPDYVNNLLRPAHGAVKAACPSTLVISGALTPAGNVGTVARDDIEYLAEMYQAGLKNYSDAIGAHPSGFNCPADADWRTVSDSSAVFRGPFDNRHHSWCFRGTMEGYRNVMMANGDSGKQIWVTEFGWAVSDSPHTGYEYAKDNTYDEQAEWIVKSYEMAEEWGWVGAMFLWNLNFQAIAPESEAAAFGIVNISWQGFPSYHAIKEMGK
ncbi:MAG TPA: LysM domain-containing protein, partial [Ardenticatenaceae bacterium]|nr:LysM domain-containing protein [Ardenticatenaceae bacterium]